MAWRRPGPGFRYTRITPGSFRMDPDRTPSPPRGIVFRILFFVLMLVAVSSAKAAVWTVEKDGSRDFTVIQDAIDAAAPGDREPWLRPYG